MNYQKFLPIGSVVLLKEGKKRIMITGFCCIGNADKNKTYDYSGCLYPEGFLSSDKTLLFDHDQIEKVYYIGYSDDEEKKFQEKLKKILEKINQE